jgi:hypothetical protein
VKNGLYIRKFKNSHLWMGLRGVLLLLLFVFETGSCDAAQADHELTILLTQLSQ